MPMIRIPNRLRLLQSNLSSHRLFRDLKLMSNGPVMLKEGLVRGRALLSEGFHALFGENLTDFFIGKHATIHGYHNDGSVQNPVAAVACPSQAVIAKITPTNPIKNEAALELVDLEKNSVVRIRTPLSFSSEQRSPGPIKPTSFQKEQIAFLCDCGDGNVLFSDSIGNCRVYQIHQEKLRSDLKHWRKMIGRLEDQVLSILYSDQNGDDEGDIVSGAESEAGKQSKPDGPVKGGGEGEGQGSGEGSGEGSGRGGNGDGSQGQGGGREITDPLEGEGRLSKEEDITQLPVRTTENLPADVAASVREMHNLAMEKKLKEVNMSAQDLNTFSIFLSNVQMQIRELRVLLESLQAKEKERSWIRNQSTGDIDDRKLVEGVTGERNIYRKRGEEEPEMGSFQEKPKRFYFVFDLSASMARFNGHDGRLDRTLESALLIMETFKNLDHKFTYQIFGHSGDGALIPFVSSDNPPKAEKDEFLVIKRMSSHAQFCLSGDSTLEAVSRAVTELAKEDADERFVIVTSDANIEQYSIQPADLAKALRQDDRVHARIVFLGALRDQAQRLEKALPSGQAYICSATRDFPKIITKIFLSTLSL